MNEHVLVIEDSLVQAEIIKMTLELEGHTVTVSHDGKDLLDILRKRKTDLILLDILLPSGNGFELLKMILENEATSEIPTIMITRLRGGEDVKKALDIGAYDYIKKPVDPLEIIARVQSAMRLKNKQDLLKEFAIKDKLTKLHNRAYFDDALINAVNEIKLYEKGFSLAMLDCDNFKEINDTYGHSAGDVVLSGVANVIYKSTKSCDVVCRFGGDEFCVLLTNVSEYESVDICERIRLNIERMKFYFEGTELMITISIGVAHLDPDDKADAAVLAHEADQALYTAKRNGRNRVEFAERLPEIVVL